jgi:hypothetical protein
VSRRLKGREKLVNQKTRRGYQSALAKDAWQGLYLKKTIE